MRSRTAGDATAKSSDFAAEGSAPTPVGSADQAPTSTLLDWREARRRRAVGGRLHELEAALDLGA